MIWPGLHQIIGKGSVSTIEVDALVADVEADHLDGGADGLVGVNLLARGLVEPGEVAEAGDDLADALESLAGALEEAVEVGERVIEVDPLLDLPDRGGDGVAKVGPV